MYNDTSIKPYNINIALSGMGAGIIQSGSLCWLRTINKNQYYHGTSFITTFNNLYKDGKLYRFFRGNSYLMLDVGFCRFGDSYIYSYIKHNFSNTSLYTQSILIGTLSTPYKLALTPLDTLSTNYHIYGKKAHTTIAHHVNIYGYHYLFSGGSTILTLNLLSNTVWFYTYMYLDIAFKPLYKDSTTTTNIYLYGIQGLLASVMSDITTNPIRVLKTYKQTHATNISYIDGIKDIVNKTNITNFFIRGLSSRLFIHGIQSSLFVILWKKIELILNSNTYYIKKDT